MVTASRSISVAERSAKLAAEFGHKRRSLLVAYLWLFGLGLVGAYQLYLGNRQTGMVMVGLGAGALVLDALSVALSIPALAVVGGVLLICSGVKTFVDVFRLPWIVKNKNAEILGNVQQAVERGEV